MERYAKDKEYIKYILEEIEDTRMKTRVAHELCTYAKRAFIYKWLNIGAQVIIAILPIGVIVANTVNKDNSAVVSSFLAGIITAVTGLANVLMIQSKWQHYRSYCEMMKQEVQYYLIGIDAYKTLNHQEKNQLFGERIESIVNAEAGDWKKIRYKKKDSGDDE